MAIMIIKMRTPDKYLAISLLAGEPYLVLAPNEITK